MDGLSFGVKIRNHRRRTTRGMMKGSPNNIHAALEPDGWFESLTWWQMTAKSASPLLGCPAGAARLSHPALWPVPPPIPRARPRIKPWSVPSLRLDPEHVVELLQRCNDRSVLKRGVAIGADITYWFRAPLIRRVLDGASAFPAWCCPTGRPHSSGLDAGYCRR